MGQPRGEHDFRPKLMAYANLEKNRIEFLASFSCQISDRILSKEKALKLLLQASEYLTEQKGMCLWHVSLQKFLAGDLSWLQSISTYTCLTAVHIYFKNRAAV